MHDVIVVGARCAGAPTAMHLARRGHRVLLLDRASFPSDTLSTHFLRLAGVVAMERWGLLGALQATQPAPVERVRFNLGGTVVEGSPPAVGGLRTEYAPRRYYLDKILVDAAAEAGAEVRTGFAVQGLLRDEAGQVVGVRGGEPGTPPVELRARLVIGADGRNSMVAREVDAPRYWEQPSRSFVVYSYWEIEQARKLEMWLNNQCCVTGLPTHDGQTAVIVQWPVETRDEVKDDLAGHFMEACELVAPPLAERMRRGKRAGQLHGIADLPGFFRRPYGPGWALVGDAGYHKDPFTGFGMSDAFRDSELVAEATHRWLAGEQSFDEGMKAYEDTRNEHAGPLYALTCRLATLEDLNAGTSERLAQVGQSQAESDALFGFMSGTVSMDDFVAFDALTELIIESMSELPQGLLDDVE